MWRAAGPLALLASLGLFLFDQVPAAGWFYSSSGSLPMDFVVADPGCDRSSSKQVIAGVGRNSSRWHFSCRELPCLSFPIFHRSRPILFRLGWSEASRYYYGSLVFAARIYGERVPLSILHPTRYFLQSVPFVSGWTADLGASFVAGPVVAGHDSSDGHPVRATSAPCQPISGVLTVMWFFLYLLQGAVYYHLQVMIWIILLGVSARHPWRSLAAVVLASIWAGMSRVNWFPMPAMLAIGLYLLEEPVSGYRNFWRYMLKPAMWLALGLLTALASQSLYIYWSGNQGNLSAFGSSFTSDLIWERLWANPTYPLGVVPGILIVSAPMIAVIVHVLRGRLAAWHPIRLLGLAGMLAVLVRGRTGGERQDRRGRRSAQHGRLHDPAGNHCRLPVF